MTPDRQAMLLAARLRLARRRRVRTGRGVLLGRGVRFDVAPDAEVVLGDGCSLGERTRVVAGAGCVRLGPAVVLGARVTIVCHAGVTIGAGAVLEDGAVIVDFDHVFEDVERPIRLQPLRCAAVTIGAGSGICLGASVLAGVQIGDRATVGPHAVVTADVPAGMTVQGVPARPPAAQDRVAAGTGQAGALDRRPAPASPRPDTKRPSNPSADSS